MPQNDIPLALLFFNVGVEPGQILFIPAVLSLVWATKRVLHSPLVPRQPALAPAYFIGGLASYWMLERIAAFWH